MLAARHRARLTMEDRNVDLQEGIRLRSVRRRLFPEDDEGVNGKQNITPGVEDNIANCFFEEARRNREEAKKRWNFDFEKEMPLPGKYEWVKVDKDRSDIDDFLSDEDDATQNTSKEEEKETKDSASKEETDNDSEHLPPGH